MSRPKNGGTDSRFNKRRADVLLVERGLAATRSRAQSLLLSGRVFSAERRVEKSGELLAHDAPLEVRGGERYVSRGGDKLEGALEALSVSVVGLECADIGASTGGFTDCLLQHGAVKVHSVDVGHGLLALRLREDERVHLVERTNARRLTPELLGATVDLAVVDASFISVTKLLPAIRSILRPGGRLLALVKPQFEAGREEAARGRGVIRDPEVRARTIREARAAFVAEGFELLGGCDSKLPGPKGNLEYFVLARRTDSAAQSTSTQRS
ncbi:MAG TPA: TlyA family RNA methyltransferase [Polyangiaceae bacterium]|nr:TlyA family RNA methyltransferase [Polyangiaceae bacterium]